MEHLLIITLLLITLTALARDHYEKGIQKEFQISPYNLRAVFSKVEWDISSAKYFGRDTAPYRKDVACSLELFANFKPESGFHSSWEKIGPK